MKKPKKITVKFFLNKNLNPISIDGQWGYPLYTQITYDRKNTQIKCVYGGFYKSIEQVKEQDANLLQFEEKILKRSVNYELSKLGDEFRLKGLGRKYENYCLSTHALFNSYLKLRFRSMITLAEPKKFLEVLNLDKSKIDFLTIFEASERLFDNLNTIIGEDFKEEIEIYKNYFQIYKHTLIDNNYQFPVVIDWLEGSHIQDIEKKLGENFKHKPEMTEKSIQLIQKIISTKLELI